MRANNTAGLNNLDWMTFGIYISLMTIGWLMIYTVGYGEGYPAGFGAFLDTPAGKQTIWIGISLVTFFGIFIIDGKFWRTFAYLIYAFSLVLLIALFAVGTTINGATSWFSIGSFSLQPSEFAKFGTCLAIASFLSAYNTDLDDFGTLAIVVGLFIAPMILILLQPDAGSALVFFSFLLLLYRQGLSSNYFIVGIVGAILLLVGLVYPPLSVILGIVLILSLILVLQFKEKLYWLISFCIWAVGSYYLVNYMEQDLLLPVLLANVGLLVVLLVIQYFRKKDRLVGLSVSALIVATNIVYLANYFFNNFLGSHQQDRINVWLRPELCDPRGALYNVLQSKMAIGSGGFQGKGFLQGTMTKLNYVPEQSTDFIFCTVGEEQGFIGSFGIIALFVLLLVRITLIAERQRSVFSRDYAYGIAGIIFVHFLINIGMTMGIMPIIGIPLPFISKGGSSLLGFTIMIAVLLKLDSNRSSYS